MDTLLSARITVDFVDTEFDKDFVRIYDSLDSESAVQTYTGRLQYVRRHRAQNTPGLVVHFKSDMNIAKFGFKITIEATSRGDLLHDMAFL